MVVTRLCLPVPWMGVSDIGIFLREAESNDGTIFGGWNCGRSLNCKVRGHFENFASASGRDMPGLTGISPWKALSEGGE